MNRRCRWSPSLAVALLCLSAGGLRADCREAAILENANAVLTELAAIPLHGIPPALLKDAQGVAILPGVVKAGIIIGGRHGRGVLLAREADCSWSPPQFLTLTGASFGHQLGVQATDLVLVFRSHADLKRMMKGKLTLGADAAVAAGPLGREAQLGTDVRLQTGILSYSRSKGLFVGLSLEGAALLMDPAATADYYRAVEAGQTAPGVPASARLQAKLSQLSAAPPPAVVKPPVPSSFDPSLFPRPNAAPRK